jgi:hypothetical protein
VVELAVSEVAYVARRLFCPHRERLAECQWLKRRDQETPPQGTR